MLKINLSSVSPGPFLRFKINLPLSLPPTPTVLLYGCLGGCQSLHVHVHVTQLMNALERGGEGIYLNRFAYLTASAYDLSEFG